MITIVIDQRSNRYITIDTMVSSFKIQNHLIMPLYTENIQRIVTAQFKFMMILDYAFLIY